MEEIPQLKTKESYFIEIWNGFKRFELRFNDRDYKINDEFILIETKSVANDGIEIQQPTGRKIHIRIKYVLHSTEVVGLMKDFCTFSFIILAYKNV